MAEPTTEKPRPDIEEVIEELKSYVNTSVDLFKLKTTEKGAEIAASTIINIIMAVLVSLVLLFASLALAFLLSAYFDKMYIGFLIVAGIYALLAVIMFLSKDKWLKLTLVDNIIKAIYSN